jgi:MFS family permease
MKHIFFGKYTPWHRLPRFFGWTRTSYFMLSGFIALLFLIGYVWWPLVVGYLSTYDPSISFWRQMDWLLLGNFLVMSLLIMAHADLKNDLPIVLIGLAGGLTNESWGTQTNLWFYYTYERPPLWIIPAWPIASLSIDRLFRLMHRWTSRWSDQVFEVAYWAIFVGFYAFMVVFVWPTRDKSLSVMALLLCAFLILTPVDRRAMVLTFAAGAGLGYFLERWGTTRACWTYYTYQTPPFFAILAHGMAAVAFWRVLQLYRIFLPIITKTNLLTAAGQGE